MSKKSTRIALGGMFSALCLVLMFMTGMIPFATYAIPAAAGVMLLPVMEEVGTQTAVLVYVAVSVLSVFIVPDREAAMMFVAFFGYYPILKQYLDRIPLRLPRVACKLAIFNAMIIAGYYMIIVLLGMPDIAADMGDFGKYSAAVLLGCGNLVFIIYDFALVKYYRLYVGWFKPRFLRR